MSLSRHQKITLTTISIAAAVLVAGCSSGGDTVAAPSLTLVTEAGATPGMSGMSSMPAKPATMASDAPADALAKAPAPQSGNAVDINNFDFAPMSLTIPAGATVTWTNHDEEPHTVAASDGSFHSPGMGTGGTYSFTFTNAGTYDYVCSIHPFMHGTVVVTK